MTAVLRRWFGGRPRVDPAELERQERSWAELSAGRLPLSAQERLAGQLDEHVFTSDLSTRDLVAVRAAGYSPVGQAFGTAIYRVTRQTGYYLPLGVHPGLYRSTGYQTMSSRYSGPAVVPNTDRPELVSGYYQAEVQARSMAMRRLEAEARGLGADGVIGVRVLPADPIEGCVQFSLFGTAVRSNDPSSKPAALFTTTLAAPDFGQLLRGGWAPTGILFELARYAGHAGYPPTLGGGMMNPLNYQTGELTAASMMLDSVRVRVRETLAGQVHRHGGTGMIMDSFDTVLHHHECQAYEGATDYFATASAIGNSIVPIAPRRASVPAPGLAITPVLRLDREGNREL